MRLAVSLLACSIGCATASRPAVESVASGGTFYYRPAAAAAESAEGKKNVADEKADRDAKSAEVKKAADDAQAAKAVCDKAESAEGKKDAKAAAPKACPDFDRLSIHAQQLYQSLGQQHEQTREANAKHLADRIGRVAAAVAKSRHLSALIAVYPGSEVAPSVDLTEEVRQRLDDGGGKSDDDLVAENERLRGEIAARDAQLAEARARTGAAGSAGDHRKP